jgi:hypothetical protein
MRDKIENLIEEKLKLNWIIQKVTLSSKAYMNFCLEVRTSDQLITSAEGYYKIVYHFSGYSIDVDTDPHQKEDIIIYGYPNCELGRILYEKSADAGK